MPVSIVVGGQFGSEGKGKVAHWLAGTMGASAAIRVGGSNSGHTAMNPRGEAVVFRQLPTAALLPGVLSVIPAGSYIDTAILLDEIRRTSLSPESLVIDPHAAVITDEDLHWERTQGLRERIGSTLSGTGAAVMRRIARDGTATSAANDRQLQPYVRPTTPILRALLDRGARIVLEGTQGFGLSLLHGTDYPCVTSRDTTAAGFLAEAGLSPRDVDDVVLVTRAFPIRVPGPSGVLPNEIDWATLGREAESPEPIVEYTSVTRSVRRVARFDGDVVRKAIEANNPTRIVLNHLDYVDSRTRTTGRPTERVLAFLEKVTAVIGHRIDHWGFSASSVIDSNRWWLPTDRRRGSDFQGDRVRTIHKAER